MNKNRRKQNQTHFPHGVYLLVEETTGLMNKEAYGMVGGGKCCEARSNLEAWGGVVKAGCCYPQ